VTFGPDGAAYFASLTWANFENPPFTDYVSILHSQTSIDGGQTWSLPSLIGRDDYTSDKNSIAADPNTAGTVYATWRNDGFGLVGGAAGARQLLFSKSTDSGHTWSSPTVVSDQTVSNLRLGNPQVAALPSGTIIITTSLPVAGVQRLLAFRSTDQGQTWSEGITILDNGPASVPPFSVCGANLAPGGGQPGQIATFGGNGVVILTLSRSAYAAGGGWQIVLTQSRNGGKKWTSDNVVTSTLPITFPSVAGSPDNRLGVMWDETDPSATDCTAGVEAQRTRFSTSQDSIHWSAPITVGAPWWNVFGLDVGDYHSLAATPAGFNTIAPEGPAIVSDSNTPSITGDTGIIVADITTTR
jgi:hypothetical protein